jgi:multiple sugar transport system substrate-binding protein
LQVGEALKAAHIVPTAVGAQAGWPAAAWFDYLNLRTNGLDFHQKLLRGDVAFNDPRVRKVFAQWKALLDRNFFLAETVAADWDRVLPFLYRERVGMVLLGGFAAAKFPGNLLAEDIGFFPFPRMSSKIPMFEEAPLDVLVLPSRGENRTAAHRFLRFLSNGTDLNRYNDAVSMFSPLVKGQLSNDTLFRASQAVLDGADGISFFFDRDARSDLVQPAFEAFKAFMLPPHDIDAAVRTIHGRGR